LGKKKANRRKAYTKRRQAKKNDAVQKAASKFTVTEPEESVGGGSEQTMREGVATRDKVRRKRTQLAGIETAQQKARYQGTL